ncbi:MAG TPA: bifunctional nuclease family protein [Bacteroides sp.]|nr:bifunctional nuclease family protein [Bacteroides sp.]
MSKIKLNVLGISYSQTQSGAYALVLTEEEGDRRIPIIVGGFEAQSIAIQLEGLKPPRPLTHDLFMNFAKSFHIDLLEVNVYKLEEGVFYSKLYCDNGEQKISIDTRTSDAIALALRFKCPIYTTEEIMERAGIVLEFGSEDKSSTISKETTLSDTTPAKGADKTEEFKDFTTQELNEMLKESIGNEDYERASIIQEELNNRTDS